MNMHTNVQSSLFYHPVKVLLYSISTPAPPCLYSLRSKRSTCNETYVYKLLFYIWPLQIVTVFKCERIYAKKKNHVKEKFSPKPEFTNHVTMVPCSLILWGRQRAAPQTWTLCLNVFFSQTDELPLGCQCNRMYLVTCVLSILCLHFLFHVLLLRWCFDNDITICIFMFYRAGLYCGNYGWSNTLWVNGETDWPRQRQTVMNININSRAGQLLQSKNTVKYIYYFCSWACQCL